MDPNYHYIPVYDCVYVNEDAPLSELGLPDDWDRGTPVNNFFYVYALNAEENYDWGGTIPYNHNGEKFINYLLKLGDKAKHLHTTDDFRIVRVPNDVKEYASIEARSSGCCGSDTEYYVQFNREKAIIDATKAMLEEPTMEKVCQLKERIAYLENIEVEDVIVPHLSVSHDFCNE